MQFQAESLAQALRLAEAKAQDLVRSVPQSLAPQLESHSFLLLLEVQKVLRQALALQQLAALPKVAPLMEPPVLSKSVLRRLALEEKAQALVEVEARLRFYYHRHRLGNWLRFHYRDWSRQWSFYGERWRF